jgi:hypothetical protein
MQFCTKGLLSGDTAIGDNTGREVLSVPAFVLISIAKCQFSHENQAASQ